MTPIEPVDIILIAGARSSKKTSALAALVDRYASANNDAVLITELGPQRIHQLLGRSAAESLHIRELFGACACCSGELTFRSTLVQTLRRRPRRIWIELSEDASVIAIRRILDRPGLREAIASIRAIYVQNSAADSIPAGTDYLWTSRNEASELSLPFPQIDVERAGVLLDLA